MDKKKMCGGGVHIAVSNQEVALLAGVAILLSPVLAVGGAVYVTKLGVSGVAKKLLGGRRRVRTARAPATTPSASAMPAAEPTLPAADTDSAAFGDTTALHEAVTREVGDDALQENIRLLFAEASKPAPTFQALMSLGAALYLDGDYLVAERYLVEAVKRGEDAATGPIQLGGARHLLGMVLARQADFLGAESAFAAAAHVVRESTSRTAPDTRDDLARPYAVDPSESDFQAAYCYILYQQHRALQRSNSFRFDGAASTYVKIPRGDDHDVDARSVQDADRIKDALHRMESAAAASNELELGIILAGSYYWFSVELKGSASEYPTAQMKAIDLINASLRELIGMDGGSAAPEVTSVTTTHPNVTLIARALSVRSQALYELDAVQAARDQEKAKALDPNVFLVDLQDENERCAPWPLPPTHGASGSVGAHDWEEVRSKRPQWCNHCGKFMMPSIKKKASQCKLCNTVVHLGDCQDQSRHCLSNVTVLPEVGDEVYLIADKRVHQVRAVDRSKATVQTSLEEGMVPLHRIRSLVTRTRGLAAAAPKALDSHHHTFHPVKLHKPTWCGICSKFIRALKAARCDVCEMTVHDACKE